LVLGGNGLLGRALRTKLESLGLPYRAPGRDELDLSDLARVPPAIAALEPAAVWSAAAYTDVAAAERPENRDRVFFLNRDVPEVLARAARDLSIPFVHVSTDYVFDGTKDRPYTEEDRPRPVQVYGESKLEGELRVFAVHPEALVVRTSTLYGSTPRDRLTYVDAILAQATSKRTIEVVEPPVSSPTYATDLAGLIVDLARASATGIVHAVNAGQCSRLELARAIVAEVRGSEEVSVTPRPAPPSDLRRPPYSVLSTSRLESILGRPPRPWREALREYVRSRTEAATS
jgi:dTDP-4-dehydrorhamnose reductase